MDENLLDIKTHGTGHLQRDNRLKGVAQQKLICKAIDTSKDDLSIKTIRKIIKDNFHRLYILEVPFKLVSKNKERIYEYKKEFYRDVDFILDDEIVVVYAKERIISKKWKQCSNCKKYYPAKKLEEDHLRKCWYCRKGYFNYVVNKFDTWKLLFSGNSKQIIPFLIKNNYLRKTKLNKRVDFFRYNNGIFDIIESKNKEVSGFSMCDIRNTLKYPMILKLCGYDVKLLRFIYNGHIRMSILEFYGKDYNNFEYESTHNTILGSDMGENKGIKNSYKKEVLGFEIDFIPVGKYLENNGVNIKSVEIVPTKKGYKYNFKYGKTNQIDLFIEEKPCS